MSLIRKNPERPILTAFISYTIYDRDHVVRLINALREGGVEVLDFFENEPLGAEIETWVEAHVADADCIIVIVSENSLRHSRWIEREVGLAILLLTENGVLYPAIVPIKIEDIDGVDPTLRFQPRNFYTQEPVGPPIVWANLNCMVPSRDGTKATVQSFLKRLAPQTLFIKNPEAQGQAGLFDGAMQLYKDLLPDDRERDREVDIAHWICESWKDDGTPDDNCGWINVLAIHHIGGKVIGIFWCNVHRLTGIGFISFWGLLASHRSYGRGVAFAQEVISLLRQNQPEIRALLFAAERVEWSVLNRFLKDASRVWERCTGRSVRGRDWYLRLAEPLNGQPSAIAQVLASASARKQKAVIEQLRRFRRFALYANGANYNKAFERKGISLLAFARREQPRNTRDPLYQPMAEFVQPPIRPPVAASNECRLWLFSLVFDGQVLTPDEAIDWIYDVFLKETLGTGRAELPGWNDYMVQFRQRSRNLFVKQAELRYLRLRDWFAPYNLLLTEVKKYWVRQQVLGSTEGRWDIQL